MTDQTKGILYPENLPTFTRIVAPEDVADLVQWFWIPEWDLPSGQTSRQHIIGYPASNLVVEQERVVLSGPSTRRSYKDLNGSGWAVGALLRPAIIPTLTEDPGALRDTELELDLPTLEGPVRTIMNAAHSGGAAGTTSVGESIDTSGEDGAHHQHVVAAFCEWLRHLDVPLTDEALLANALFDVAMSDAAITKVTELATALDTSTRQLQRIAKKYIGLSPLALIKRRRIQEAADKLRSDPTADIAALAYDLGYADHSHLSNEFHHVLGLTPQQYRNQEQPNDTTGS